MKRRVTKEEFEAFLAERPHTIEEPWEVEQYVTKHYIGEDGIPIAFMRQYGIGYDGTNRVYTIIEEDK